jgi:thioesterase domain-containing protein/acyl carrier protein
MIPSTFVGLEAFPLTPSGKIDRRALPVPDAGESASGGHDRPRTAVEARLAGWFATVLDIEEVGIHDDFFDLGGHSLIAVKLFARIESETGRRIPLATLFEAPSVAALAERLQHDVDLFDRSAFRYTVAITRSGDRTPLFCVHGSGGHVLNFRDLSIALGPTQPFYGLQASGVDGVSPPHGSIEEMATAYLEEVRGIQPHGPYVLGGYSGGGLVALEMARQLVVAGEPVDNVVLLDTYPPVIPTADHPIRDRLERLRREHVKYVTFIVARRVEALGYMRALRRLDETIARGAVVPLELREMYVNRSFFAASANYVLRPYAGRTTLIRTETLGFSFRALGWAYGWDEVVAPDLLDVVSVPGAHDTLLTAPYIQPVAQAFRQHVWADDA